MSGADADGWQRLDARMLLVGPLDSLRQFAVPLIIALIGISSSQGGFDPAYLAVAMAIPVLLGLYPWLTTRYRITDTQFQQRKGLIGRQHLTASLDRVRSVDLEASLLQRALGLAKVKIGTGVDESRIELNALSTTQAEQLRHFLLGSAAATAAVWRQTAEEPAPDLRFDVNRRPTDLTPGDAAAPAPAAPAPVAPTTELARIDWSWLRFAPFSLSRLAIVAGAIGLFFQWNDQLPFLDPEHVDEAWRWVTGFPLLWVIVSAAVAALVVWLVLSVLGYVVQWWDLRLTREHGTIRLRAGLFTTRSTSVEEAKIRGVELVEPALLRLVRGAELSTLATGLGSGGVAKVLPPCPREICEQVGSTILTTPEPLTVPLVPHGRAARRRAHLRLQRVAWLVAMVVIAATIALDRPWWLAAVVVAATLAIAAAAGEASYRHLGHRLTEQHVSAGDGILQRRRQALERDGVIGWVIRQSWFQRRSRLATLVVTTAAGSEHVTIRDIPLGLATALAAEVTPGAVADLLV